MTKRFLLAISLHCGLIATCQSPGGVSGNLTLWLNSDLGITQTSGFISAWLDQSPAAFSVVQATVVNQPRIDSELQNYHYCPTFDGDDLLRASCTPTSFFATGAAGSNATSTGSVFAVGRITGDNQHLVSQFPLPVCGNYVFHCNSVTAGVLNIGGKSGVNNPLPNPGNAPFLASTIETTGANNSIHYLNGGVGNIATNQNGNSCAANQTLRVGISLIGNVAEVITYNVKLSVADKLKIESYLAIKYGISLDNSGGGAYGDYITSSGLTIWDASVNPSYHNKVMGIARDNASGLLQKQSHQYDDTTRIYISTLAATNTANAGVISSNLSAVMIGNNQGKLCATTSSNIEIPSTPYIYSRLEREWKVTNTAFNQTFNIDVRLNDCAALASVTPGDLILLVDDDGNFTNASAYSAADGLIFSYNAGVISVTGITTGMIPANSTRYITIASTSLITPLPVLLSKFEADTYQRTKAIIKWSMEREDYLDYFEVQRLETESMNWEVLTTIKATGVLNYTAYDLLPSGETNYYRLGMVDVNGIRTYSLSELVQFNQIDDLDVFPNPVSDVLYIQSKAHIQEITVIDTYGRVIFNIRHSEDEKKTIVSVPMDQFSKGLYQVKCNGNVVQVLKE